MLKGYFIFHLLKSSKVIFLSVENNTAIWRHPLSWGIAGTGFNFKEILRFGEGGVPTPFPPPTRLSVLKGKLHEGLTHVTVDFSII